MEWSKPQVALKTTILTPLIVSVAAALLSVAGLLSFLDGMAYDTGLKLSPELPARDEIIFIDVDDRAIDYAGTWPIRRDLTRRCCYFHGRNGT